MARFTEGQRVQVADSKDVDKAFVGMVGTVVMASMGDQRYALVRLDEQPQLDGPVPADNEWAMRKSSLVTAPSKSLRQTAVDTLRVQPSTQHEAEQPGVQVYGPGAGKLAGQPVRETVYTPPAQPTRAAMKAVVTDRAAAQRIAATVAYGNAIDLANAANDALDNLTALLDGYSHEFTPAQRLALRTRLARINAKSDVAYVQAKAR